MDFIAATAARSDLDEPVPPVHAITPTTSLDTTIGIALCGAPVQHGFDTITFPIDVARDVLCAPCVIQAHPQGADGLLLRPLGSGGGRAAFMPFDESAGFEDRWWHEFRYDAEHLRWYSVDSVCEEVARVELELDADCGTSYGITPPAEGFVEITFIEVRENQRRRGIGRRTVEFLTNHLHPGRQFAAFSEEADEFWASLGWTGHYHPEDRGRGPHHRTLFISPPDAPTPPAPHQSS